MITKLQSLPNFIRAEASPKVQDSAFPPFKIEHRYKGVYERAGFDVNLGGMNCETRNQSISSGGYLTPPGSASPTASNPYFKSDKMAQSGSGRHQALAGNQNKSAVELRKKNPSPYINSHTSATSLPMFQDHKENGASYQSVPYTSGGKTPYESEVNIVLKQNTFDTSKQEDNIRSVKPTDHQMNHKNLRLHLGASSSESGDYYGSIPSKSNASASSIKEKSTSNLHNLGSPVKTSNTIEGKVENEIPYPKTDNSPYPDFNGISQPQDININVPIPDESDDEQQFNFNSPFQQERSMSNSTHQDIVEDNISNEVLSNHHQDESPKIPPRNEQRTSYDSPTTNSSVFVSRFDSFVKNSEMNSRGSIDNEMLNPNSNDTHTGNFEKNTQRISNLSMVSSIISKQSDYEDDEIERELERQLQSLKVGGSVNGNEISDYEANYSEDTLNNIQSNIPTINVENIDNSSTLEYSTPNSSFHVVNTSEFVSMDNLQTIDDPQDETHSTFSFETVEPLDIRNNDTYSSENSTSYIESKNGAYGFNNNIMRISTNTESKHLSSSTVQTGTLIPEDDDFVKPLSPKTHHVEQELRCIGMRNLNESSNTLNNPEESNYPLQNITNQDFFPSKDSVGDNANYHQEQALISVESVTESSPVTYKHESEHYKYPPGQGPCRSCNLKIIPDGKGSQRAIHSKSGELSGQWHRGCFHCNYPGCKVLFNKNVQCYVLNDSPLCHKHYHEENKTICESCKLGIEGECVVNEIEQKWHLNCLLCHSCANPIKSDYYLINGSVFCEKDAEDIINGRQMYGNNNGLTAKDKIEKRRTRLLYVE